VVNPNLSDLPRLFELPVLMSTDFLIALEHLLPLRQLTTEDLADIISKRHCLQQRAKESNTRHSQAAWE
jgi:hypothetical protein